MNKEQVNSGVRYVIATFGGMIAGWGASRGWLTADQIMAVFNSELFIGLIVAGVTSVWGIIARSKKNQIASVAAMPEVKAVVTTATIAGREMAASVPAAEVVTAGTSQATELAKAN